MYDLSIIIVNWNTKELLRRCLNSIYHNTNNLSFEVLVVDNASSDGSADMVAGRFPQVGLTRNKHNYGFARGNNQGFLRSKGEYILILNPDTEVVNDALLKMAKYLKSNEEIGAVSGRLVYPDGAFQRYYSRFPTFLSILTTWFLPKALAYKLKPTRAYLMLDDDFSKEIEAPQPAGSCLMVKRDLFLKEYFMDEQFPIFFNDVDLCRRIYNEGKKIVVLPYATIIHHRAKGGSEKGKRSLFLSVEYFLGMIDYFSKHEGVIKAQLLKILLSLGFLMRSLFFLMGVILTIKTIEEFKYELKRLCLFLGRRSVFSRSLPK